MIITMIFLELTLKTPQSMISVTEKSPQKASPVLIISAEELDIFISQMINAAIVAPQKKDVD
jgi:hypothetical protein